ncbi:MAG: PIN domain-containing protein [Leptospiraceae bacterium]|nr:PIN domain-containing protein [Leptospiraceae bacterium]
MILIDTDVCIEILRGNKKVINKRNKFDEAISISFMTVAELFYGAQNSSNPEHNQSIVEEFLLTLQIIQSDFSIMKRFGSIKATLKKKNNLVPDADIIIASTAIEKCEFLVTGNTEHFSRMDGLKIDNWIR